MLKSLSFLEYREGALRTAIYPDGARVIYPLFKLAGETGEAAGKVLDSRSLEDPGLLRELGDVLWYVAALSRDLELENEWLPMRLDDVEGAGQHDSVKDALLGLVAEAGKPAEKIGKLIRDQGWMVGRPLPDGVRLELGEMLWGVLGALAEVALLAGSSLLAVAHLNLEKLASRQERGVITGSGDNR